MNKLRDLFSRYGSVVSVGHTEAYKPDGEKSNGRLRPEGVRHAREIGTLLRQDILTADTTIATSPRPRCVHTADIIIDDLGVPLFRQSEVYFGTDSAVMGEFNHLGHCGVNLYSADVVRDFIDAVLDELLNIQHTAVGKNLVLVWHEVYGAMLALEAQKRLTISASVQITNLLTHNPGKGAVFHLTSHEVTRLR